MGSLRRGLNSRELWLGELCIRPCRADQGSCKTCRAIKVI